MALSQITPSLFLGGSDAAQDVALMSRTGITLVINVTLCVMSAPLPGVEFVRVPVSDLPSAPLHRHFDSVAERIHGNREGKTLVHCAAGRSRSPTLVMAYLMRFRGVSLRQAHALVTDKRPIVRLNRGFWEQLLTYEKRLYGNNSVRLAEEEEGNVSSLRKDYSTTTITGRHQLLLSSSLTSFCSSPLLPLRSSSHNSSSLRSPLTSPLLPHRSTSLTSSHSAPPTPRLRRAELVSNRKCVPSSPLTRCRAAALHRAPPTVNRK